MKTHCPKGHEYTAENTFVRDRGGYECRSCIRQRTKDYRGKHPRKVKKSQERWKLSHPNYRSRKLSPTEQSWANMKQRCNNPNSAHYRLYGGRGIRVCERWMESFSNFLADMGERPKGKTLDRYPDNDGNYEPRNCRWATQTEQKSSLGRTKRRWLSEI